MSDTDDSPLFEEVQDEPEKKAEAADSSEADSAKKEEPEKEDEPASIPVSASPSSGESDNVGIP